MKYLGFLFLALSSSVFACWRLEGEFVTGKNKVKISQMVNHDEMYSVVAGDLILNFKIPSMEGQNLFLYELVQRQKSHLKSIVKNKIQLKENQQEAIRFPVQAPSELKIELKEI